MATPTGGSAESSFVQLPSLPAKSPSPPKSKTKPIQPELKLPLIPATKTEKYLRLRYFDRHVLKRHKAHFRNALKTTDGIQKITKQLNEVTINTLIQMPYIIDNCKVCCKLMLKFTASCTCEFYFTFSDCHLLVRMMEVCHLRDWLHSVMLLSRS